MKMKKKFAATTGFDCILFVCTAEAGLMLQSQEEEEAEEVLFVRIWARLERHISFIETSEFIASVIPRPLFTTFDCSAAVS